MFLSHQHETTLPPIVASPAKSVRQLKQQQIQTNNNNNNNNNNIDENTKLSDCQRLKTIIDEIRPEVFHEFSHKITRTLEKTRRELGEGNNNNNNYNNNNNKNNHIKILIFLIFIYNL